MKILKCSLFPLLAIGLICSLLGASPALSATVKKINKKKKIVYIDQGSKDGVKKGMKVCFKDSNDKKITCSKVRKTKKKSSQVKVKSKKKLKKIKKGFTAEVVGLDSSTASADSATSGGKFLAMRMLYLPGLASSVYNRIEYLPPATDTATNSETLWSPGTAETIALLSFGLEVEYVPFNLAYGITFAKPAKVQANLSDYVRGERDPFISSSLDSSSIGGYFDYFFMSPKSLTSGLRVGAGVDFDMSTMTYEAKLKQNDADTAGTTIFKVSSKLTVVSLRLPVGYELNLGGFGLNFGLNLIVPLSGDTPSQSLEVTDTNASRLGKASEAENKKAAQEDIAEALGHTKAAFAAELVLGAAYAF